MRAILLLLILLPALAPAAEASNAFGVSPGEAVFGRVVRGEPVERTLLVQNARDEPVEVTLSREGEAAEWVSAAEGAFTVPAHGETRVRLTLAAPADAPHGAREGHVAFTTRAAPVTGAHSGAAVSLAVRVPVRVEVVGEGATAGRALGLDVPATEPGAPLTVRMEVTNTGNVRLRPSYQIEIVGRDGAKLLEATSPALGPIPPGRTETLSWSVDHALQPGVHRVRAVLREGDLVLGDETASAEVAEPGALRRLGRMGPLATRDDATREVASRIPAGRGFTVLAPFENVGEAPVDAVLVGHLLRDGVVVRELSSETRRVEPGESVTLRVLVPGIREPGAYLVAGAVRYGGRETPESEWVLTVVPAEGVRAASPVPGPGVALVAAAAVVALLARRR